MFKMIALLFVFVNFVVITSAYHQTYYSVIIERYNILHYDKNYVREVNIKRVFVTRFKTKFIINACLLKDLNFKYVNEHIQGRKFQSNEYRLFPFNYTQNSCLAVQNPLFGNYVEEFNCSLTNIKSCYIEKGCYSCTNIVLDDSKYPPFAPRGRFKIIFSLTYNNTLLLGAGELFIEIKPTNPLERVIGV